MKTLLPILALFLLPVSTLGQSWSTLPVDLLIPMNTSPTHPPGTPMTAAIASAGTVSNVCTVGSTCYFGTFPAGFEVGANQGTCTNLGPIQMNGSGGVLYPAQSLNYNNYAHEDSANSAIGEFYFSPVLSNTQFSVTTCMTIGFPNQENGNANDMFMIQNFDGNFDVLQLAFSCPNDQIFGTRVETWPDEDSSCVPLVVTPTGTATFTNGSTTVTGTAFTIGSSWNNGIIYVGPGNQSGTGTPYTIASVQSATSLTLATPYTGTTGKESYSIIVPAAQTYYLSTTWDYASGMACYWVWTPQGAFLGNGCVAATGSGGTANIRLFSNENGSNRGTYTEYQNIMMDWTASAPTGTATFANGSTTVTGSNFTTGNSWNNGILNVGGTTYTIASVQSPTSLTLTAPFSGTTGSANYAVELPLFWTQRIQGTTSQTITFGAISNQPFGTPPFTISATASSGLAVSFNSQTAGVCSVSGTTVTLNAVGTCTIQATQAGNATYAPAPPVNQSFQVTQASQTITFGALPNQPFGSAPFSVSATASSGLAVSFNSQTTAVCSVSGTTVTLLAVGTCTIQATQSGNSNYAAAAPVNQSFNVTQASQTAASPTFSPGAGSYAQGQSVTISTATSGCDSYIYWNFTGTALSTGTNSTTASITTSETLYAQVIGCPGYTNSAIASAAYTTNLTWTLVQHAYNFNCTTSSPCSITTSGGTNQSAMAPTTAGDLLIVASTGKYAGSVDKSAYIVNLSVSDSGGTGDTFTHCPNSVASYVSTKPPLYGVDCYYTLTAAGGATSVSCAWLFSGLTSPTTEQDCELLEYRPSITPIYYDTGNVLHTTSCTNCTAPALLLNGADDLIVQLGTGANDFTSISAPFSNPDDFDSANLGSGFAAALNQSTGTAPPNFSQSKAGAAYMSALAFGPNPTPTPTYDTFINFSGNGTANGGTPNETTLAASTFGVAETWRDLGGAGMTYCNSGPASNLPGPIVVNATAYTGGTSALNLCGLTSSSGNNIGYIQAELFTYSAAVSIGFTVEWTCPANAPSNGQCGNLGGIYNNANDYATVHVGGASHTGEMYLKTNGGVSPKKGGLAVTAGTPYRVNLQLTYGGTSATYQMVVCADSSPGTILQAFALTGTYAGDPYIIRLGLPGDEPTTPDYNYYWRNVVVSNTGLFSTNSCIL